MSRVLCGCGPGTSRWVGLTKYTSYTCIFMLNNSNEHKKTLLCQKQMEWFQSDSEQLCSRMGSMLFRRCLDHTFHPLGRGAGRCNLFLHISFMSGGVDDIFMTSEYIPSHQQLRAKALYSLCPEKCPPIRLRWVLSNRSLRRCFGTAIRLRWTTLGR